MEGFFVFCCCLFFTKHKTHKMQLRVCEGREFSLKRATNVSWSISKEIILIFLSRRKNSFVYIILQLDANIANAADSNSKLPFTEHLLCTRCCPASFMYLIPPSHQAWEAGTITPA